MLFIQVQVYPRVTKVIESRAWATRSTSSADAPCWCHESTTTGIPFRSTTQKSMMTSLGTSL